MTTNKAFSEVIEALKQGKIAARACWDEDDTPSHWTTFIFMQVPSTIPKDVVQKMQSLPQSVKDEFEKRFNLSKGEMDSIHYKNQFCLVRGNLLEGWSPSPSDLFATDWYVQD